ncbi:YgiT-type zinc finger protein [Paenibacillus physcomitrellae]|uniref:YgiT-type zinc finger domain-containing protein n=1 Tax=Paenibacillus physcomitrellae TaxID=1619311 RepID=A0ABQ1FNF6_9BACL|nr:YgiT-type zinc finger protein [Paenibacillus physcomitrellae]GGA21576.1 hypothetical protein GCM10010917_02850 [Paenibacillus physcomitrellae]
MDTPCNCGQHKSLGFRTVIHGKTTKIKRVPVWECEQCGLYELFPCIKQDLRELLVQLKDEGGVCVSFSEYNELADVMYEVYKETRFKESEADVYLMEVEARCKERINLLLDVYGYAKQNEDHKWMKQLMTRLSQLTFTPAETT